MQRKLLTKESSLSDVLLCFNNTKKLLADALGVSKSYISLLDMDEPLPRYSYLKLCFESRPDLYRDKNSAQ